jgi:ubiquinone/menaquinone biosynthesis C-methylase UbiE
MTNAFLEADMQVSAKSLLREFDHPATYLWRTCETALLAAFMKKHALASPVLDLGCAEGIIARSLFGPQDEVVGLDNCWELLSAASTTVPYRWRLLGDGCRLPFADGTFSSVFSNCVIEHIPDLDSVLAETGRVLKPGGRFMFTVPSATFARDLFFSRVASTVGLGRFARAYGVKRNALLNHYHCYDEGKWAEKLKNRGFELIESVSYMPTALLMLWDALAAYFYVMARVPFVAGLQMRAAKIALKGSVLKGAAVSCRSGGALLVVAVKGPAGV